MYLKVLSILVASILATLIVFFFGFVTFNVIPAPSWYSKSLPYDNPALEGLKKLESGTYQYPNPSPESEDEFNDNIKRIEEGPILTLYIHSGMKFSLTSSLIQEVTRAFLASLILSFLLSLAHSNLCCYSYRVFFVSLCGLFAAISCETTYSIWFFRSCGTTTWMFMATFAGWTLAAFAIAYFVKPWEGDESQN